MGAPYEAEYYKTRYKLRVSEASIMYSIDCFGDELAEKHGYDCDGIEAVYLYLMNKHNWRVDYVRSLNISDLSLALNKEMKGWSLPHEAVVTANLYR